MDHDFLIIGGGIAGVSVAAQLACHGSVLVLEAEDSLAHHASGRSAALFEPRYGLAPVVELSLASEATFRAMAGVLSPRGLMIVGRADQDDVFARDAASMRLDPISIPEARGIVPVINPEVVTRAAFADHAWDIDTDLLLQGYVRQVKAAGGQIVTGARASAITRIAGRLAGGCWRRARSRPAY